MADKTTRDVEMRNASSSSPSQLSSPPSALSEPASPSRYVNKGRANIEMGDGDEIVVDTATAARFGLVQPAPPPQPSVQLTAAGLPRKKPGRKPGTHLKPKVAPLDGSSAEAPKVRRPRKPRDPNAPPIQRKRKAAAVGIENAEIDGAAGMTPPATGQEPRSTMPASNSKQPKITELASMRTAMEPPRPLSSGQTQTSSPAAFTSVAPVKREPGPSSMKNILNDATPQQQQSRPPFPSHGTPPISTTRQIFDPVRGNYDPVRETMVARDPYGTNSAIGSPRAPSQSVNRASASPSIACLVDPPLGSIVSPGASQQSSNVASTAARPQDPSSMPPSPIQAVAAPKQAAAESKRAPASISAAAAKNGVETTRSGFTTLAAGGATGVTSAPSKKLAAVAQQDKNNKKGTSTASSSPRIGSLKDALPALPAGSEKSILDFGKAAPGEEASAPSIVLHIPLNGETNKYVNFMRMAEDRYGWDALHPRQAAHRERKARIAAASAALEKTAGRESGDEMSVDLQSDGEGSNVEMGGMGNGNGNGHGGGGTSGPDGAPTAKPARKKRNFKEDEYDREDDFVDDSELLWEEQAAASKDGFFVYSGPLVPEVEKPPAGSDPPPRRGRGGRGRGGTTRGAREGAGRGRGGGPGSRGGLGTRKPRITKLEKQQLEKEKAERERMAQATSASKPPAGYNVLSLGIGGSSPVAGLVEQ